MHYTIDQESTTEQNSTTPEKNEKARRYRVILLPTLKILDRGLSLAEATLWTSTFSSIMQQSKSCYGVAIEEEPLHIPWQVQCELQQQIKRVS